MQIFKIRPGLDNRCDKFLLENIVKNGDFETGDLAPWYCTSNSKCVVTDGVLGKEKSTNKVCFRFVAF